MSYPVDYAQPTVSEFSDPDAVLAELFPTLASTGPLRTGNFEGKLQDDHVDRTPILHGPVALNYSEDTTSLPSCRQTHDLRVAVTNLRPTINIQQPAYGLTTSDGYSYIQEQSPTTFILTSPDGQNNPGCDALWDSANYPGSSMTTPSLGSCTTATSPCPDQPAYPQSSFFSNEGQLLFDQDFAEVPLSETNVANIPLTLDPNIHYPSSPGSRRSSADFGDHHLDPNISLTLDPNIHYPSSPGSRRSSADFGDNHLDPNIHFPGSRRSSADFGDSHLDPNIHFPSVPGSRRSSFDHGENRFDPNSYHAGSKRPSMDLGNDSSSICSKRKRNVPSGFPSMDSGNDGSSICSKRSRKVPNGFPCPHLDCTKGPFDRKCDARKHFKNVHASKAYSCDICGSGHPYPKDVKRHKFQVHNIPIPRRRRFSTLRSVVSMALSLGALSLRSSKEDEEADRYILVSHNHMDFRKIYLKGIDTSEALLQKIGSTLKIHPGGVDDAMLRRCGSRPGRMGEQIPGPQLMDAATMDGKTLELVVTPKKTAI